MTDEPNRCHRCGEPIPDRAGGWPLEFCNPCREAELRHIASLLAPVGWES